MSRVLTYISILLVAFILNGCDSSSPDDNSGGIVSVRYEVRGMCNGVIGINMMSVGYTVDGGGTVGKTVPAPWVETFMIDTSTTLGGVGLSANCVGSGTVSNVVTAEIFVDDVSADITSDAGLGLISVNVSAAFR